MGMTDAVVLWRNAMLPVWLANMNERICQNDHVTISAAFLVPTMDVHRQMQHMSFLPSEISLNFIYVHLKYNTALECAQKQNVQPIVILCIDGDLRDDTMHIHGADILPIGGLLQKAAKATS